MSSVCAVGSFSFCELVLPNVPGECELNDTNQDQLSPKLARLESVTNLESRWVNEETTAAPASWLVTTQLSSSGKGRAKTAASNLESR